MSTLLVEETADRVLVRLNRPDVRNAINAELIDEFLTLCARLEAEPRILIVTGSEVNGKGVFAAGADIAELIERGKREALRGITSGLFDRIARLPMPTIAAVDGFAIGGGAELAYATDIRIASTRAVFGNPEPGIGILAAAGATWRLPALVGESLAKELLFTGRRLDAQEALAARLVSSVHDPDDLLGAAHGIADQIAAHDPLAIQLTKRVVDSPRGAHPAIDGLAQAILFESDAKQQRMSSFLNRGKERS